MGASDGKADRTHRSLLDCVGQLRHGADGNWIGIKDDVERVFGRSGADGVFNDEGPGLSGVGVQRPQGLAAIIIRSCLGIAGFLLLAAPSVSAAPDWCKPNFPFYPPDVSGHYFRNDAADPLEFSVNIYNPGGPYTQSVAVSISGYGTLPCHITSDGANFVCDSNPLPLLLSEGEHTASYTCNAVDSQGNAAGSHTEQISFGIDNSKPIVAFAGPAPGTTFSPFSTITVSGIIRDFSPLVNLAATSSNGPPSASRVSGNNFAFDFCLASSTNNFFSTLSTTALSVHIGVFDSVGFGDSDLASIAFTLDGVPPSVSVSTPVGTVKTFAAISGTASDFSGIAEVKVGVRNKSTERYWNGSGFAASTSPIFLLASGSSQWSLPLESKMLPSGQTFEIYVAAKDTLGNKTNSDAIVETFSIPQGPMLVSTSCSGNLSGLFTFTPTSRREIQYGGELILCAEINPNAEPALRSVAASEVIFEVRTGGIRRFRKPGDGSQMKFSDRLPGTCGQNGVPIKIFSDPAKCIENDLIVAKMCGSPAGVADIVVLVPTDTESAVIPG